MECGKWLKERASCLELDSMATIQTVRFDGIGSQMFLQWLLKQLRTIKNYSKLGTKTQINGFGIMSIFESRPGVRNLGLEVRWQPLQLQRFGMDFIRDII